MLQTAHDDSEMAGGAARDIRRRCVAGGETLPPEAMVRFVVGPEGDVVPDILGKLPGRGLWVRADRDSVAAAARGGFARSARRAVRTAPDLPDRVEALLTKRCIDLIALARRAGEAVAGFEKVRGWLVSGRAAILVEAADGAEDGRGKVVVLADGLPMVGTLTASEIGGAFGRERTVHVALSEGGLADRLRKEAARLGGFRTVGEWGKR